jgi:ABC-type phosphate transport system substrate-binding protein
MRKIVVALALLLSAAGTRPARAQDRDFVVIVNTFNPFVTIRAEELSHLFLKKAMTWSNGQVAMPVDQREDSPLRRRFAARVLNKDTMSLKSYWQQMVFSGKAVPPPALDSDDAVLEFVRRNPYAVGYVSAATPLSGDVRVLPVVR